MHLKTNMREKGNVKATSEELNILHKDIVANLFSKGILLVAK